MGQPGQNKDWEFEYFLDNTNQNTEVFILPQSTAIIEQDYYDVKTLYWDESLLSFKCARKDQLITKDILSYDKKNTEVGTQSETV